MRPCTFFVRQTFCDKYNAKTIALKFMKVYILLHSGLNWYQLRFGGNHSSGSVVAMLFPKILGYSDVSSYYIKP